MNINLVNDPLRTNKFLIKTKNIQNSLINLFGALSDDSLYFRKKSKLNGSAYLVGTNKFIKKLQGLLCLECSIWEMFFNWSFIVSIIDLFLSKILSCKFIILFFIFLFNLVINCKFLWKSSLNNLDEIYPLSPNNFPHKFFVKNLTGFKSETFPGVIWKDKTSPYHLQ